MIEYAEYMIVDFDKLSVQTINGYEILTPLGGWGNLSRHLYTLKFGNDEPRT